MKKWILMLLPLILVGCKEEEKKDSIQEYGCVYVDAMNCLHGDRGCEFIGIIPSDYGSQVRLPYIDYLPIDELSDYDEMDYIAPHDDFSICAYCITDQSHAILKEKIKAKRQ